MSTKAQKGKTYEIDMTRGPLFGKIIRFSVSLLLTNILQLLYNAADLIVVGQLSKSETAVAAIGATGSMSSLIVCAFIGLSVGASVLVAQGYGTADRDSTQRAVHTSISLALISGILVAAIGLLFSRTFLEWMETSPDIIDQSTLYLAIYFAGAPFNMLYNFGSAILRATGDTKRPFYFLTVSGLVNVILNIFFVTVLSMDVAGVALATVISQAISATLVILCLTRQEGICRLSLRKLRIDRDAFIKILKIGLPACIQNSVFAISNIMIQSSINSFDTVFSGLGRAPYTTGSAASANIEGFVSLSTNTFHHAALNFTGQNYAAGKYKRTDRILVESLLCSTAVGIFLGVICIFFGKSLLSIYIRNDAEAIGYGYHRLVIMSSTYFLCGLMDVLVGQLRGLGRSTTPTVISILGICGFRILWIETVFAMLREWEYAWETLFFSYPISWIISTVVLSVCYASIRRKFPKEETADRTEAESVPVA